MEDKLISMGKFISPKDLKNFTEQYIEQLRGNSYLSEEEMNKLIENLSIFDMLTIDED